MTPEERAKFCASLFLDPAKVSSEKRSRVEQEIAAAIREAVKATQDADALLCQQLADAAAEDINEEKRSLGKEYDINSFGSGFDIGARDTATELAAAIRARTP